LLKFCEYSIALNKVKTVLEYIHDNLHEGFQLEGLAQSLGLSSYYFSHAFRSATGIPTYQYILRCRVERAKLLLKGSSASIVAIAHEVGFGSQSHMTTVFRSLLNVTPKNYRHQAQGINW
jgi:AraC family transcriptional regulator